MGYDFLIDLDYLGLTARLKRLNDAITKDIKQMYLSEGVDIEPSWHLVFLYLEKHKTCTLTETADAFHISLPAAFKLAKKMKRKGYLEIQKDKNDNRKKVIKLTPKARTQLPNFERIWDAGQNAIRDSLANNKSFLSSLRKFEKAMEEKSFKRRIKEKLDNQ